MDTKETRAAQWRRLVEEVISAQIGRPAAEHEVRVTDRQVDVGVWCISDYEIFGGFDEYGQDLTAFFQTELLRQLSCNRAEDTSDALIQLGGDIRCLVRGHVRSQLQEDAFRSIDRDCPFLNCDDDSFAVSP